MTSIDNTASLKHEFRDNVCRGCLAVSPKELSPIAEGLLNYFTDLSQIVVLNGSELPHRLCSVCLKSLRQCVNFKNKCQHANRILSELLQSTVSNNGRFDLSDLRKERQKLLNDYSLTENLHSNTNISKTTQRTPSNLLRRKNTRKKTSLVNNENSLCYQFNHTNPEEIYESISSNFFVVDSMPICSNKNDDFNVEESIATDHLYEQDTEPLENHLNQSNNVYYDNESNIQYEITNEVVVEIQDIDCNMSDNSTNNSKMKHLKKQKDKSCKSEIQRALEKSLHRRTIRNNMKAIRGSFAGPKKVTKRPKTIVYCPFDESSVNIVKLTLAEQIDELEAARASKRYIESPYKCEMCAKGFVHELTLQDHLVKHNESAGSFVCGICQLRYVSLHNLRNHHLAVHEERLECKQCDKVLSGRSSMAQHVAKHNGLIRFPACKICGKISNSPTSYYRHLRSHKPVPYKCAQCNRVFKDKSNLLDHSTRVHSGVKNYKCGICQCSFATKTGLKAHAVKHSNKRDYYCVECDIRFKTQASLTHHLNASARHPNPDYLKFQCDQCEKRYDTALKLKLHVECSHLHMYKYSCEKCPSKFQTSGALKTHRQRIHEGKVLPKKHVCNLCDKAFTYRTTLMNHILIHTGEQPHICEICSRAFRQKAALQTHINLVHLKIKRPVVKRKDVKSAISNEDKD